MNAHWTLGRAAALCMLVAGAAITLLPFFWMLSLSFKAADEIFTPTIELLPRSLHFANYVAAFTRTDLPLYLMNGAFVCAAVLFFQVVFAVPLAFALAQRRFLGSGLLFGLVIAGLLVPFHVTAIPIFLGLAQFKLINTYTALILPFVASVFGVFLFRQAFRAMPAELFEAARVDGLSETAIVWRIAFPLALPSATAFAIFSIVAHWNDLFWPLIATTSPELATPPRGILYFRDRESGYDVGPLMAATVIVVAPMVAAFLVAQRRFVQGIAAGGLKG
ncbi:MAG: carbohydrate ABC transporter permease [Microvirga sp.]|nr:carbohydrate ABC transporter permease [Microvirga sp.]